MQEMLDAMPKRHQEKVLKFIQLLESRGPDLTRPYADAVRDKIRELVVDIQHHAYRFLHFYSGRTIVVTHGFLKKEDRTPVGEIERAERRMADWVGRSP